MRNRWLSCLLGTLLLALAGCGASEVQLHGTVTANGNNVEEGEISFMPLDNHNSTHGAPIKDGKYTARIPPGKYAVAVTGGAKGKAIPLSQEELKNIPDRDLYPTEQVPADAKGNNQEIEFKAGTQEFNIPLEYSAPRK